MLSGKTVLLLKPGERKGCEPALSLLLHVMLKVLVRVKREGTEKKGISIVNEGVQHIYITNS